MIYLDLFLTFFEVGAVSFGGGYGMISLIRELVIGNGWMTEEELLNFIAVSESTPGPIAINMATFIGSSEGGILGAFLATLGVVLPAFIIILLIAMLVKNLLKYPAVKGILRGVRPCVVGLIIATGAKMLLSTLFSFSVSGDRFTPSYIGCAIFLLVAAAAYLYKRFMKKKISPILLILFSAICGAVFYAI